MNNILVYKSYTFAFLSIFPGKSLVNLGLSILISKLTLLLVFKLKIGISLDRKLK